MAPGDGATRDSRVPLHSTINGEEHEIGLRLIGCQTMSIIIRPSGTYSKFIGLQCSLALRWRLDGNLPNSSTTTTRWLGIRTSSEPAMSYYQRQL